MARKTLIMLTTLVSVGLLASAAWAWYGGGYGGWGYGGGPAYSGYQGPNNSAFWNATASLREKLAAKQGEYNALMNGNNPDPQKAGQLQKEIVNLRNQIQAKARKYNAQTSRDVPPYPGYGYGYHHGYGRWPGMPCWGWD